MTIRVRLFAIARQLGGGDTIDLELPAGATIAGLREELAARVPALAALASHLLFAVNQEYAPDTMPIPADAEVACIPPVSGG